jgi:hypothetical protein
VTQHPARDDYIKPRQGKNKMSSNQSNQPTVELKAIAASVLGELQDEGLSEPLPTGSTFQAQLNHIDQIKTRQLSDYIEVCILRLQHISPEEESTRTELAAQDHLCILKAILSV